MNNTSVKRWLISISTLAAISAVISYAFPFEQTPTASSAPSVFSGIVQQEEYNLSFKIGGRIGDIRVEEGQAVKKGDLLGTLEKGEWQAKVDQAKAAVSLAEANVEKAMKGVDLVDQSSQAKIDQAEASLKVAQDKYAQLSRGVRPQQLAQLEAKVTAAQSAYELALDKQNKMNQLYQSGAVPQMQRDEADVSFEKAKAELTAAQQELEMAKEGARREELDAAKHQVEQLQGVLQEALSGNGQVELSESDVQAAKGQLAQAQAKLEEASIYLTYTELRAPVDGVVVRSNVKVGEMVSEGFTAVTLAEPKEKWVTFYIPENRLQGLKEGKHLTLSIPSLNGEADAVVASINPAPQFAAQKATNYLKDTDIRSFEMKVRLTEKTDAIFAGMTAEWQGVLQP